MLKKLQDIGKLLVAYMIVAGWKAPLHLLLRIYHILRRDEE